MSDLITAGECPIDGPGGDLISMKANESGLIFFACPPCGVAWDKRPPPYYVERVDPLETFAPYGAAIATQSDVDAAGLRNLIRGEVEPEIEERWKSNLAKLIESAARKKKG